MSCGTQWLSSRALSFRPSLIGQISRLAESCNAVNLSEGFPNFPAPNFLKAAGMSAIEKDFNQYCYVKELCVSVAENFEKVNDMKIDGMSQVSICCGQSGAFTAAILSVINPGDDVLILNPSYETYVPCVVSAGGNPVFINLMPPDWVVTEDILEASVTETTKAIIVNSPNNPTGRVLTEEELQVLSRFCCKHDILAITDEVYEHLIYGSSCHVSLATFPGMQHRTIVTSSISKTFCVTGWRIGWAISPPSICAAIDKLHCKINDCPPSPFQFAALTALQSDQQYYTELKQAYEERKDAVCDVLKSSGFGVSCPPQGGMFAFVEIPSKFQGNDVDFTKWLIQSKGVAVVPGSNFFHPVSMDASQSATERYKSRYVRVAFCKSKETIHMASEALRDLQMESVCL